MTETFDRLAMLMERQMDAAETALSKMDAQTALEKCMLKLEASVRLMQETMQGEISSATKAVQNLTRELGLPATRPDGSTS